jgi:CRP-like cAMP-binding protein
MAQKPSPTQDESSPPRDGGGPSRDALNIIHKLQDNYSFFAELLDEEVAELVSLCKKESYEADQVVFREGDIADHFYLVLSGEIAITIGKTEVARMEPGHIFGEMALLEHIPRTATATAVGQVALFYIPAEIVNTKIPNLALKVVINIARQISEKLRESNTHIRVS